MKVKQLQTQLKKSGIDALILFYNDPNFFYFFQRKLDNSFLVIPKSGKAVIFHSPLESIKTNFGQIIYKNPYEDLKKYFAKKNIKVLGINESRFTLSQKKKIGRLVKLKDVSKEILTLRKTKTPDEIKYIKEACKLTEKVLRKIIESSHYKFESDIVYEIKKFALKKNLELSFEPIVASGNNAAIPHYTGDSKLKKGFLVIDLGYKYKGYCADITRTFYIGKPSEKELSIYSKILEIQENAIKMVKPGAKVSDISAYVRREMGPFERYFNHSLGHGLGVEVHESPGVSTNSKSVLVEGMIITIEPGIYKNFGIRIEDDVLVTKNGYQLLSNFSKKLHTFPKV